MLPCAAAVVLLFSDSTAQQKRIYIANDDHTDYIWTANEAAYKDAFLNMLDYYLTQADQTDTLPSDFQGRFNADGNFWMWTYQKNRSPQQFQRLISRIRDAHITIPMQTLVELFGAMPTEAVLRAMYYSGRIERQHNLRFELAVNMENQTLSYGLPSLWAGAGAKYSWKGVCGCATTVTGLDNRSREIYRALGPDGRTVLLKWHSLDNNQGSGGYAESRNPSAAVTFATTNGAFLSRYPYDLVVGMFGKGWDDFATYTNEFITTARAMSNPSRRVIVSNQVDFFHDFESSAPPDSVPSYGAGFGNEWELDAASIGEVTASMRRSIEGLRTAEALATYASIIDPGFMSSRSASAESAFVNIGLYYEHDLSDPYHLSGAERSGFQRRLATQINNYVSTLRAEAAALLASNIKNQTAAQRFYVFNPLGWSRTDVADIQSSVGGAFRVIDVGTGQEVRSQRITVNGQNYVRVLAENVQAVG
ncbi:MAG: glycoside hydrolase, partial [Bacteroidota bacterium]